MISDLHIHTKYSDGTDDFDSILTKIRDQGISLVSITDHETTDFYTDNIGRLQEFNNENIKLVLGVEIACLVPLKRAKTEVSLDILMYNINLENIDMFLRYNKSRILLARVTKFEYYRSVCLEYGIDEAKEWELPGVGCIDKYVYTKLVEIYKLNPTRLESFLDLTNFEDYGYVVRNIFHSSKSRMYPSSLSGKSRIDDVCRVLKRGGVGIVAHPGLSINTDDIVGDTLDIVNEYELHGIELVHPSNSIELQKEIYCKAKDKILTGGSDYHGYDRGKYSWDVGKIRGLTEYINTYFEGV